MEGSDWSRFGFKGATLVETMVAAAIFALLLGLTSQYVSTASSYPFLTYSVEPWLNYMEETTRVYRRLPDDSHYLQPGSFTDPLPTVVKPPGLVRMEMTVSLDDDISGLIVAQFHATSIHEKTYRWRCYRFLP